MPETTTRHRVGTAAAPVTIAYAGAWDDVDQAVRQGASSTPTTHPDLLLSTPLWGTTEVLWRQLVVGPLPAGPVTGSIRAALRAKSNASAWLQARVRVVSGDGLTTRPGEYFPGSNYRLRRGEPAAVVTFDDVWTTDESTGGAIEAQAGDWLVVEVGWRVDGLSADPSTVTVYGAAAGDPDLPLDEGNLTATGQPWVELTLADPSSPVEPEPEPEPVPGYRVDVTVAGHSWAVSRLDGDPLDAQLGPVAPLVIGQELIDGQLWPAQEQPETVSFGLVAATATELADVVEGADLHVAYWPGGIGPPITFDGDVSDVAVTPHRYVDPDTDQVVDGVLVSVVGVGYLARLWEEPVQVDEAADVDSTTRLANLFTGTGQPQPTRPPPFSTFDVAWAHDNPMRKALQADGDSLGPLLDKLLTSWPGRRRLPGRTAPSYTGDLSRLVVRPVLDEETRQLDAATPWELVPRLTGPLLHHGSSPGTFGQTETGGWGVVLDVIAATSDDATIDGDHVDRQLAFTQRKRSNVSRVVVTWQDGDKQRSRSASNGDQPVVRHTIDSDLTSADVAVEVAQMYLPAPGADGWGVDGLTWRLYDDDPGRRPPPLGSLVTAAPMPASINPTGKAFLVGMLTGWSLTVAGGRPIVQLQLRTVLGRVVPADDAITWADLATHYPTVTWADLNPTHTWTDYLLIRSPDA